ncbi:hypothetical protein JCM33374_g1836 [Metschnikowia sp. JCM 33374]|nr:hypothetical protein JCM33374_g1836 [Metschnikowia sp. JCM 33374]
MSKSLALFAFESLISELESSNRSTLAALEARTCSKTAEYPQKAPLFVTWNKNGDLRGCIGTFSNMVVEEAVAQYALISAFEDTRFTPILESELPSLSVSITLLDNFVEIKNPKDWIVGKHGLKVSFTHEGRAYSGTFLPSVAEEQEWTPIETLWNLLRKAGFKGITTKGTLAFYKASIAASSMKLVRYDGLKCGATYQEYLDALDGKH